MTLESCTLVTTLFADYFILILFLMVEVETGKMFVCVCRACIGSRDPYCVWDSSLYRCMASSLSADGSQDGAVPV